MNFGTQKNARREYRSVTSRIRGGELHPVKAHRVLGNESGMLKEEIFFDFDPVAGRIITPVGCEIVSVFVPLQAMDLLANPDEPLAGSSDAVRQKLLSGVPILGLEEESELSMASGVTPRSINGSKMVSVGVRLAHNCAVNFLRRRKYVSAKQVLAESTAITPALIGETILDRMNAVLDPEDRINGSVNFEGQAPIRGVYVNNSTTGPAYDVNTGEVATGVRKFALFGTDDDTVVTDGIHQVFADLGGVGANISLTDFYQAERMDELVRQARKMVDANPEYGETMVAEWAHGLSVDPGKQPFVLYSKRIDANKLERLATDGNNLDESQTDMTANITFTVPLPRTEFGGMIMTFASVKPDETLSSQPHPTLTEEWVPMNHVADELAIDPVPVTFRELDADVLQADEGTTAFYMGNNHLYKSYINYGYSRELDRSTVARKTAVWQLEIPMSVTPESVVYPATLDHYPWVDFAGDIVTLTSQSWLNLKTPIIFGPSPVEELAAIEDADVFEDAEEQ